jgi:threonine dehydratase
MPSLTLPAVPPESTSLGVTFDSIIAAEERIAGGIVRTPCEESFALSELCACRIHTKLEYLQRTGSFKERGARNALMLLSDAQRSAGVVAASAGNHALALAFHGRQLGIAVTVVMPKIAPLIKQTRCRQMGAEIIISGENIAEAKLRADEIAAAKGLTYVHGFNDAAIIAGQGTIGLEILEQVSKADAIVVPVGGAGMIAGIGLAVKTARPRTQIIGVEPENAASLVAALQAGKPVGCSMNPTLADGLAVPTVGERAFEIARRYVDRVVTVNEESISLAILRLAELEKGVVEGAGATPLAAFLSGQLQDLAGKRVVLVLAGGNIDPTVFSRVIEHGLAVDGRLTQFTAVIRDRPGGLAELALAIASTGASVKQVSHERAFGGADVSTVQVLCTVEVRDRAHTDELYDCLQQRGIRVVSRLASGPAATSA